jgi:hypothetical protein
VSPNIDPFTRSDSRVWPQRSPIAYPRGVNALGTVAAPLLAGFSLTTVVQLVTSSSGPWLRPWCISLFSISAVLFLYSLQYGAEFMKYTATPSERLEYAPEARGDSAILDRVRARSFEEMGLRTAYETRFKWTYNIAIILFMSGFGTLLFPHYFHSLHHFREWNHWPWGNVAGLIAIAIAIVVETIWTFSNGRRPRWIIPQPATKPPVSRLLSPTEDMSTLAYPDHAPRPASTEAPLTTSTSSTS